MKKTTLLFFWIFIPVAAGIFLFFRFPRAPLPEAKKVSPPPGVLRVLVNAADFQNDELHRAEMPIDRERALLQNFARSSQLKLEYIPVPSFAELFQYLQEGKGDLISANLAETKLRKEEFLLSRPFEYTREIVFTSDKNVQQGNAAQLLKGKIGMLLPNTTYAANFSRFAEGAAGVRYKILPCTLSHELLIDYVQQERFDYSVLNECDLDAWLSARRGIRKLFPIRDRVPLVFAARKDSVALIKKLNSFIERIENQLKPDPETPVEKPQAVPQKAKIPPKVRKKVYSFDLKRIKKRGFIRMLTINDAFCCYLKQGRLCGLEYELGKRFADSLGVQLLTVIPPGVTDLFRYLEEGKGDFIAANLTRIPERLNVFPNLTFGPPYHGATEVLAGRLDEKIRSVSDLANRRIYVTKGNSYYWTLCRLQAQGAKFTIVPIPENETALIVLQQVASGKYDLTVVDDNFLNFAVAGNYKVKPLLSLSPRRSFAWVVRKSDPELERAVRAFFKKENKSTFFNMCVKRNYSLNVARRIAPQVTKDFKLRFSRYDALFRKYGKLYDFDWLTLAAQAYQESRFNPKAVNGIGAAGLMQITPRTAAELGIRNLTNPENGIHAGTKYLDQLRSRFPEQLKPETRHCFALASYNAGYGHVSDARILAKKLGLNPDLWFYNTEKALKMLEDPRYAAQAKYGYCRASETIPYVRNIALQSLHYQELLKAYEEKLKTLKVKQTAKQPTRKVSR